MLVDDLFDASRINHKDIYTIRTECSHFIQESNGLPVYRALPRAYDDFRRVKVRYHNRQDTVSQVFNSAFDQEFHNIIPRGIFAQSAMMEAEDESEPFYIFPINGYKFIYSKGVQNSNMNFRTVIETLQENVDGAFELTRDLIKYTYSRTGLCEGIKSNSELIFFNVPYFYAVRASATDSYTQLINNQQP